MTTAGSRGRHRRIRHALGFALLCAAVVAAAGQMAIAGGGPKPALVLGKTKHTPKPLCPQRPSEPYVNKHPGTPVKHGCQVVGSVTGFEQKADGRHHAFRAPRSGRIVAWAVKLANTNRYEEKAFGDTSFFGTKNLGPHATARIAVLKRKGGPHYKLLRQSAVVDLTPGQGRTAYFTLSKPLKIKKGLIVALTTQTWAPLLASNARVAQSNTWRASRRAGKCEGRTPDESRALAIAARPQIKPGSTRQYGCQYQGRLLYWAYYTPGLN